LNGLVQVEHLALGTRLCARPVQQLQI
jgi:hypothetical protein